MRRPRRIVSSVELLAHPRQHVVSDVLELPSGRRYEYVYRQAGDRGVYVVATTSDGAVLFVSQYRHPVRTNTLELPAGSRNDGETVEECAFRELYEETGYRAANVRRLGQLTMSPASSTGSVHVCIATEASPEGTPMNSEEEHTEVVVVPRKDVRQLLREQQVSDAGSLAALLFAMAYEEGP